MRLFEAAFKYLSGVAGITSLIGSGTACRLYELHAPQDPAYPFITVEEISEEQADQFGGLPTVALRKLEFTAYSQAGPTDADAIAQAVYAAIMGQEAAWTTAAGALTIRSVHHAGRRNDYEWDLEMAGKKLYSSTIEFEIWHTV